VSPNPEQSPLLTVKEAAKELGQSKGTVYALYHKGRILGCPWGPKGGAIRIFPESVRAYLRGEAPPPRAVPVVKGPPPRLLTPPAPKSLPGLKYFHL
jgi:excisionase family DNA binding protein